MWTYSPRYPHRAWTSHISGKRNEMTTKPQSQHISRKYIVTCLGQHQNVGVFPVWHSFCQINACNAVISFLTLLANYHLWGGFPHIFWGFPDAPSTVLPVFWRPGVWRCSRSVPDASVYINSLFCHDLIFFLWNPQSCFWQSVIMSVSHRRHLKLLRTFAVVVLKGHMFFCCTSHVTYGMLK